MKYLISIFKGLDMISRCCRVIVNTASSLYSFQLDHDWYECSKCHRPCDTMNLTETREGRQDEQL